MKGPRRFNSDLDLLRHQLNRSMESFGITVPKSGMVSINGGQPLPGGVRFSRTHLHRDMDPVNHLFVDIPHESGVTSGFQIPMDDTQDTGEITAWHIPHGLRDTKFDPTKAKGPDNWPWYGLDYERIRGPQGFSDYIRNQRSHVDSLLRSKEWVPDPNTAAENMRAFHTVSNSDYPISADFQSRNADGGTRYLVKGGFDRLGQQFNPDMLHPR